MTFSLRRSLAARFALFALVVAASASLRADDPPAAAEPLPPELKTEIGGRNATLKRTGTAIRKKLGLKFYQITGYCCTTVAPRNVDAVAAADVAKRLVLVMERDIPDWVLRRSFEEAFANNDPEGKFPAEIKTMLDHMTAQPLKKGDRVTITHVPQTGVECQIGDAPKLAVSNVGFAHVVWNVYMGPRGCDANLRSGLGTELAND